MATASASREATSKPEAYVQRRFTELCARIQRIERLSRLLSVGLIVVGYACLIGWYDYVVGATSAVRWVGFAAFLGVFGFYFLQAIRAGFRRVNPYYVARQLEQHLPDSKNSLINWLDLHDDQLPSAFQKNLSARAAEQLQEGNPERAIRQRKHWVLLGLASLPTLGLLVLLLLGPAAFFASMMQAFAPFYVPANAARTQITLLEPQAGDAEVSSIEAVTFAAKIEGRVPIGNRPDAPKLHYRYQAREDFLTSALQRDADGNWTTQLSAAQVRTGVHYKITAGDAETPMHQITVRGRLHATSFDVTYRHRPYLNLKHAKQTFTSKPMVHGLRGTEVELTVRANRPVQSATVEILTNGVKKDLTTRLADDKRAFACSITLEQSAMFRLRFNAVDGEANADRDWYPIDVRNDAAPTVILTTPGKDITLPENGTLTLEGRASDDIGIKNLALHLRVAEEPSLVPIPYELGLLHAIDASFPKEVEYLDVVALDQLKNAKGTTIRLRAGLTIEYWLEAIDNADVPNLTGNIGKSTVYKVLLTLAPKDAQGKQALQEQRDKDNVRKKEHTQAQNHKRNQQKKDDQANANGSAKEQQQHAADLAKQIDSTERNLENAFNKKEHGETKGAESQSGVKKESPPPDADSPPATQKNQTPMSPDDTGHSKDKGEGKSQSGEAKNDGGDPKKPKNDPAPKGERKNGPTDNSAAAQSDSTMSEGAGTSKDGGMMGMDAPPPTAPKIDMADAGTPKPSAKGSTPPPDEPQHGDAKGIEQTGPDVPNKGQQAGAEPLAPPEAHAKSGKTNEAGDRKDEPQQGDAGPGQARDNEPRHDSKNPDLRDLAQKLEQLAKDDANADKIGAAFADLAKNAGDPRVKDLAKEVLDKNGRDANTGQIKKGPNRFGSDGKSDGISDEIKATIANREFAARIGQMQLDDWKKQLTPDLLKRAGVSEADWQRFLKNREARDALVRKLNAELIRNNAKELRADGSTRPGVGPSAVQSVGPSGDRASVGSTAAPPELIDAERRLFNKRK